MSKNLIYMVAVDHDTSTYKNSNYAKYAKLSWKFWCKKNNVDFIVIDKHHDRYKFPVWNKDTIFDIVGDTYSAIYDAHLTKVLKPDFVKITGWFDNEAGYCNRAVDLIQLISS